MAKLKPVRHEDQLSLVDHLDELRTRIIVSIVALAVTFAVCFWQSDLILDIAGVPVVGLRRAAAPARTVTPDENRRASGPECTSDVDEAASADGTEPTAADHGMHPVTALTAQSTVQPVRSAPL